MPLSAAPILNTALRAATLATRFALMFILAKFLDSGAVGQYGLFTATITYALLCVGLDLYVYTTREIVKLERSRQGSVLKNQAAVVSALYLLFGPVALLVLPSTGFPTFLIWWLIPILVLEHLNQELYRLLVILSRQLTASVLLFVRQGSWAVVTAVLMLGSAESRTLNTVMLLWACAGVIAAALGIYQLRKLRLGGWSEPVDGAWVKRALAVSLTYLVATLALRAIQTFDRYWLERLADIDLVGAYVLFFGIASALSAFLDAAVFSFRYPELVKLAGEGNREELKKKVLTMGYITTSLSLLFALASSIILPFLLSWIGRDIYISEINLYYWVLGAVIAYSISLVPHYGLYALGKDGSIVASHVAALFIFVSTTAALVPPYGADAVPIGALVAMTVVFLWKMAAYLMVCYYDTQRKDGATPGAV